MKFTTSLLTAAALLASCISSIPLNPPDSVQVLTVRAGSKKDYNIDSAIKDMLTNQKNAMQSVCTTDGGWEGLAQVLLERQFQTEFELSRKTQIREVHVYKENSMAADFVLPSTDVYNGLIIELKCENKNSNYGTQMKARVQGDINKANKLNAKYKDYAFVVAAMAYSTEAQKILTDDLHLKFINDAQVEIEESDYSGSSQGGSDTSSNSNKSDSDIEMKDTTDSESDSGKSDSNESTSSNQRITLKVYKKQVDISQK